MPDITGNREESREGILSEAYSGLKKYWMS
jgi:hypothetical protein